MKRLQLAQLRKLARVRSAFRWRYVVPRAVIAAVVVLAVRLGLDPLLRWTLVTVGQAALQAKVEVGGLTTALRRGEVTVTRFAAANPQKPMRNLVESSDVRLQLDVKQLLRKRLVVRDGAIRGLAFDGPRAESGALPDAPPGAEGPSALDPVVAAAQDKALGWLDELVSRLQQDVTHGLATPRLVDELETRWPQQYEALKARAAGLRTKSKQLETAFREVKKNPLRNLPQLERMQRDLAATEADLRRTLAEIEQLPLQAKADRLAVDAARKQDEQFLRQQLDLANIDADELNRYLLGETAHDYLTQAAYWVEQAQKFVPKKRIAPATRTRGTNVVFEGRKQPACLLKRVELEGSARLDGARLTFAGELVDAASEPELHDQPLRLSLRSAGAIDGTLVVVLDRRGDVPHDSVVIDVPKLLLSDRTLGDARKLAVQVTPGEASLQADLKLDGDALSGTIWLRQSSKLAAVTPLLRDDRIAQVLHESLAPVDRLEATVRMTGTLKRPVFQIESNVGPQLAGGVRGAVTKYLHDRQERLLAKVQAKVDQQFAKLEAQRQAAEKELLAKLGEDQQLISQIAAFAQGQLPLSPGGLPSMGLPAINVPQIGNALPGNPLDKFKR